MLFRVYNGDDEPEKRQRVTLQHFYHRLGRDLRQWRHWEAFINGFHPKLFRLAGIRSVVLLEDAAQFPIFFNRLMEIRQERATSSVTRGERDLVESPARVRAWHESTQTKIEQFKEHSRPRREQLEAKLLELFPDLQDLAE
jgi:hypothetical protein